MALLLTAVAATTLLAAGVALTQTEPAANDAADRYIVVFEDDVDNPSQVASGIEQRQEDLEVEFIYSSALEGFSAEIPDDSVAEVRANPRVAYVEPDKTVHAVDQTLPWGVNRINADKSSTVAGDGRGRVSNVNVYVVDTGIDREHPDLNVAKHRNFDGGKNTDCNGHGTHIAGTLAAKDNERDVVGVAPGAPLIGIKVLDCDGFGTLAKVIKGIDWVTAHSQRNDEKSAIANLSLGGKASPSLDEAVENSANSGVFYSIAAGNNGKDACKFSPARAGAGTDNGIVTTAATNKSDKEPSWSNYGSCVDLWAPGVRILSTKNGGGTRRMVGTSMATPHVGGTGALYLSSNTAAEPTAVESALKLDSKLTGTTSKDGTTQIRLVYAGKY